MRRVLALTALVALAATPALAVQDRYGPPRAANADRFDLAPLPSTALLNWKGKAVMAAEPAVQAGPQPFVQQAPRIEAAQQVTPSPYPTIQAAPVRRPEPISVSPAQLQRAPVQAPSVPTPAAVAMAAAPQAAADGYDARPRFYSVARQYGAQPDAIPMGQTRRGEALTLAEPPVTPSLGRSYAPLDDGRSNQAVATPDTKQNAAANRVSRLGF